MKKLFYNNFFIKLNICLLKVCPKIVFFNLLNWLLFALLPFFIGLIISATFKFLEINISLRYYTCLIVFIIFIGIYNLSLKYGGITENLEKYFISKQLNINLIKLFFVSFTDTASDIGAPQLIDITEKEGTLFTDFLSYELDFINSVIFFSSSLIVLFSTNVGLTVFTFSPIILLTIWFWRIKKNLNSNQKDFRESEKLTNVFLFEYISNIQSTKFSGYISNVFLYCENLLEKLKIKDVKKYFIEKFVTESNKFASNISVCILFGVIYYMKYHLSFSDITLFLSLLAYSFTIFDLFVEIYKNLMYIKNGLDRILTTLNMEYNHFELLEKLLQKDNLLNNEDPVNYKYNSINQNAKLYLIDKDCIFNEYNLAEYMLYINKIFSIDLTNEQVGICWPSIPIFDDTLLNNVSLFSNNANSFREAIYCSNLEHIEMLRKDTNLGVKGKTLSDGQRQRIGIARAVFYSSCNILLIDSLCYLDWGNRILILERILHTGRNVFLVDSKENIINIRNKIKNIYLN